MKRKPVWILASIVVLLFASTLLWNFSMQAAGPAGRGTKGRRVADNLQKQNFDIRDISDKDTALKFERRMEKLSSKEKEKNANLKLAMRSAEAKKARIAPELDVAFSSLTDSLEVVQVKGKGRKFLTPSSSQPRENIVRSFMNDNRDLFGMSPQQVARLRKIGEYTNPNGKLSWVRMEQQLNGMRVFRGETVAAFTSGGDMVRMVGELPAGLEEAELPTEPKVSAPAAVVAAAASLGETLAEDQLVVKERSQDGRKVIFQSVEPFDQEIEVELIYFPLGAGVAPLAWSMVLWHGPQAYYVVADAMGVIDIFWRKSIVAEQTQTVT